MGGGGGIGGAIGGAVSGIAGGIGSALGGMMGPKIPGGQMAGGGMPIGYDPSWSQEYDDLKNKWVRDKGDELGRARGVGGAQRDRLLAVLGDIFDYGMPLYDELSQEQSYREFKDYLGTTLQETLNREGPAWENRVDQAERQRLAAYEQAINKLLTQDQRQMARGGIGMINPERRDELVARNMAQANDVARDQAMAEIERAIFGGLQVGGQAIAPHYAGMSDRERAREIAGLNFYSGNLMQKEGAKRAYEDAITDIMNKYREREPIAGQVKRQYAYHQPQMPAGGAYGTMGGGGMGFPGMMGGMQMPFSPYPGGGIGGMGGLPWQQIGGMAGSYFGGPVGGMIGSGIGGMIGGLF